MRIQEIKGAYEGFLARFQALCQQGNYDIRFQASTKPITKGKRDVRICVTALLYLREWPYKVVTKHKTIDILISGTEHFDEAGAASIYSNVHVNYLDVTSSGVAKIIENIHYDFQATPDVAHPFFHAQFANNQVSDSRGMSAVGFAHSITLDGHSFRYKNMRVPTAHMNLPSVLVSLAADHMKINFFEDVMKLVQSTEHRLPEAACPRMRQAFSQGMGFCRSVDWY